MEAVRALDSRSSSAGRLTLARSVAACLGLMLLASTGTSLAQTKPLVLDLPASTHAAALGNAFPLRSGSADAVFYHPGLHQDGRGLASGLTPYGSNARLLSLAAGADWFGGRVALGLQVLEYGVDELGPVFESTLRTDAPQPVTEAVLAVGYGQDLFGVQLGATGKLVEYRYGGLRDGTVAADLGAAADLDVATLAVSVQNVGQDLELGGTSVELPVRAQIGLTSDDVQLGPLDVSGSVSVLRDGDGEYVPAGGVEVGWWPVAGRTFLGRIGYRRIPSDPEAIGFSVGAGFRGDRIGLDYALQSFDSGDAVHRFGLRFR